GAPRTLARAARRAARDEMRHTVLTAALTRRFGIEPGHPELQPRPLRTLLEFALDNVSEGCVRETYGAACAQFQAARAEDADVRAALLGIAADEARHAELSWSIHDWVSERLSANDLRALELAARRAILELGREVASDPGEAVRRFAGMPGPEHAR